MAIPFDNWIYLWDNETKLSVFALESWSIRRDLIQEALSFYRLGNRPTEKQRCTQVTQPVRGKTRTRDRVSKL